MLQISGTFTRALVHSAMTLKVAWSNNQQCGYNATAGHGNPHNAVALSWSTEYWQQKKQPQPIAIPKPCYILRLWCHHTFTVVGTGNDARDAYSAGLYILPKSSMAWSKASQAARSTDCLAFIAHCITAHWFLSRKHTQKVKDCNKNQTEHETSISRTIQQ